MRTYGFILITTFCLFALEGFSQTPQAFKYQAAVRDNTGNVLANKAVTFRISILQGQVTGAPVYSELHAKTTNNLGLVDLEIGNGTSPSGSFTSINWNVSTYFLKVETDPAGGIAFQTMGTSQLLSVPFALLAKDVESISTDATLSGRGNDASPLQIAPQAAVTGQVLKWNGTTWKPGSDHTGTTSPGGSSGQIQFNNNGLFGSSANLFWDISNSRLGIGTSTPGYPFHLQTNLSTGIYGESTFAGGIGIFGNATAAGGASIGVKGSTSSTGGFGVYGYAGQTSSTSSGACGWATSANGGIGVQGVNAATSGTTYGIYGRVASPNGYSGYFSGAKFYVSGNSGFGDPSPSATLDVEGTVVIGSSGKIFSEIREITGVTKATGSPTYVSYPSGYNKDNTYVLCAAVYYNDGWMTTGGMAYQIEYSVSVWLTSNDIELQYPLIDSYRNKNFKILLMKVK